MKNRIDTLRKAATELTNEEKALVFKEATRGADASALSPEYQSLIIQLFLNTVLAQGELTINEICQNSGCSPVSYYKLMQGKYGPPVKTWLEGLNKTILSISVLPLMNEAKKQAEDGSGKHLEIVLDYLGLLDQKEEKGTASIQFVDKFIKTDGGGYTAQNSQAKAPVVQKKPVEVPSGGMNLEIE
jgi:hypothetical protein